MNLNAYVTYLYSAELWADTSTANRDDPQYVPIYTYQRPVRINMRFDQTSNFAELRTDELLDLGTQVRLIRDRNGDFVIGSSYGYLIVGITPVVNIFGIQEEYRYRVQRLAVN